MDIKEIVAIINKMRADGIIGQYAIGGAIAATFYRIEPAETYDVDVFIALNPPPGSSIIDPRQIFSYLERQGHQLDKNGYVKIADSPVQFLPPKTALAEEAMLKAREIEHEGVPVRIFSMEHLAAIAFELGRPKDKVRLPLFLQSKEFDASVFSGILERHGLLDRWMNFKKQILD